MGKNEQVSDAYMTGALLAVVGGYLDTYTYFCRGHVFANAQTGNIVLLGMKIAAGEWVQALYYLLPIFSFFFGILIAEMTRSRFEKNKKIHWRQVVIALEAVVLAFVAFIPHGGADMIANILVSFVCSLQVESFRKVKGNSYTTTMCTGNLRSATEQLYHYKRTKTRKYLDNSLQYYGIILFFITGAIIGSYMTGVFGIKSILVSCVGLLIVFLLMFRKQTISAIGKD